MLYDYEITPDIGTVSEVNLLDRVLMEDGTIYVNLGHSLFVEQGSDNRITRRDLEGDLQIQRVRTLPIGEFLVNDHFVCPKCTLEDYYLIHYRILSIAELADMFVVECVQVPPLNFREIRKIAILKSESLYPAYLASP